MPFILVRNDITQMPVDIIVCPTNPALDGSGGLDAIIHQRAGALLDVACRRQAPCPVGDVRITRGYSLPCRYILHAVGPCWQGGQAGEEAQLAALYRACINAAVKKQANSIAFPLISAGNLGFPCEIALRIASDTLRECLPEDMTAWLVLFDKSAHIIAQSLFERVAEYISDRYAEDHAPLRRNIPPFFASKSYTSISEDTMAPSDASHSLADFPDLLHRLEQADESFSQALLHAIDERNMTDAQCYKRANMDRKHFSKIRNNVHYHPRKETVLALAIALEMDMGETRALLEKAGYALSPSSRADIIVEYFIQQGEFDIFRINSVLFEFDQPTLGG